MPSFEQITYSNHARRRMNQRRISPAMVEFVMRVAEGEYDDEEATWKFVLVVTEREDAARCDRLQSELPHMNAVLTFDPDVNALYLQLSDSEVAETVQLARGVLLDVDANGEAVGLEVLNADARLAESLSSMPDAVQLAALLRSRAA